MHAAFAGAVFLGLCLFAGGGCAGKPLVQGWLEPEGTIYRQSEQEDFGSRTTIKMRTFEF